MIIRPYLPADQEALIQLLRLNTPQYFAAEEEEDYIEYLHQHREAYFVVEEEGELLGAGGINYFPDHTARISWDVVHPDHQGKGIGKRLLQYRIDQLRSSSNVKVLYVRTTQLVYPFYEKQGFALEKTEKDFWAKGFDLYQMKLQLRP